MCPAGESAGEEQGGSTIGGYAAAKVSNRSIVGAVFVCAVCCSASKIARLLDYSILVALDRCAIAEQHGRIVATSHRCIDVPKGPSVGGWLDGKGSSAASTGTGAVVAIAVVVAP